MQRPGSVYQERLGVKGSSFGEVIILMEQGKVSRREDSTLSNDAECRCVVGSETMRSLITLVGATSGE